MNLIFVNSDSMEFEHVGLHCSFEGCNQRDFLPFKCDICKRSFCGDHRTYTSHSCSGANFKDKTSIDCPLCNKSILLTMADNPDTIWEQHYMNSCVPSTGAGSAKPVTKSCARNGCRVTLSLSNTMTCSKCHRTVCLTHRIPEEHGCSALVSSCADNTSNEVNRKRLAALARSSFSTTDTKSKAKTGKMTSASRGTGGSMTFGTNNIIPKSSTQTSAYSNKISSASAKATAERRMRGNTAAVTSNKTSVGSSGSGSSGGGSVYNARGETYQCHLCANKFADPLVLLSHMDSVHGDSINNAPPRPPTTTTSVATSNSNSNSNIHSISNSNSNNSSNNNVNNMTSSVGSSISSNVNARSQSHSLSLSDPSGPEVCPQCELRFRTVDHLIHHFESVHGDVQQQQQQFISSRGGSSSRSGNSDGDNCEIS